MYYDATNVNFTENPLTSPEFEQTDSLLSQWHLPWFQNALQCTIFHLTDVPDFHEEKFYFAARKTERDNVAYASMHPFSMIQSSTLALTPLQDTSNHLFSVFIFALFFCFFTRGQSELCDELQQRRPVKCQRVVTTMEVDKENEFPPFYCRNHRQEKQPLSITDAIAVALHLKVSPSFLH